MKLPILLCLISLVSTVVAERFKRQANRCYTPDDYIGLCVPLPNCPGLLQLFANNGGSPEVIRFLRRAQSSCGNVVSRGQPVICCSRPVSNVQIRPTPTEQPFTVNPNNPFLPGTTGGQQVQTEAPPPTTSTSTTPPPIVTTPSPSTSTPAPTQPNNLVTGQIGGLQPTTSRPIQNRADDCIGPDAKSGSCISLADCPVLLTRLQQNPTDQTFAQFLRLSNEICNTRPPIICCPSAASGTGSVVGPRIPVTSPTIKPIETDEARILSPEEGCGQSSVAHRKIVGGHPSQLGSWPWLALLGYDDTNGITFRCGGSLVTKRHIVTAAHCLNRNLRMARLGEHDIDNTTETRHVDVNIVRTVRHPSYNSRNGHSDVAVLYLANDVAFTNTIGPICVPDKVKFETRSLVGYTPFVAGWGRTKEGGESANVLQEVQLPILSNNECKERYRAQNRLVSENQFDNAIVCAGVLSGGKDTCQGDSGGPLMLPEKASASIFYYNLIGVVSYGIGCARAGIPGVYANVPHFSDWIKEKIAEPA